MTAFQQLLVLSLSQLWCLSDCSFPKDKPGRKRTSPPRSHSHLQLPQGHHPLVPKSEHGACSYLLHSCLAAVCAIALCRTRVSLRPLQLLHEPLGFPLLCAWRILNFPNATVSYLALLYQFPQLWKEVRGVCKTKLMQSCLFSFPSFSFEYLKCYLTSILTLPSYA